MLLSASARKSRLTQGERAVDPIELFSCVSLLHNQAHDLRIRAGIDGRAKRGSAVRQLRAAGAKKIFREVASGAKTDRPQLRRLLAEVGSDDVVMVTRLDRLAPSPRGPLHTP